MRDAVFGTLYLGGQFTPALLAGLVDQFREQGDVGIGCWPGDPINHMLPPNPGYDGATLYFTDRSAGVDLAALQPDLPAGYRLAQRDEQLFAQSFDYEATLAAFGSLRM